MPSASLALFFGGVLGLLQAIFLITAAKPLLQFMGVKSVMNMKASQVQPDAVTLLGYNKLQQATPSCFLSPGLDCYTPIPSHYGSEVSISISKGFKRTSLHRERERDRETEKQSISSAKIILPLLFLITVDTRRGTTVLRRLVTGRKSLVLERVTGINLSNCNLSGNISGFSNFSQLTQLDSLDFSQNTIGAESRPILAGAATQVPESVAEFDWRGAELSWIEQSQLDKTWLSTDCLIAICELLKSTPKIETFVLRRIENQWFGEPLNWDEDISSLANVFPERCIFQCLKVMEIRGALGCMNELKVVQILLKTATVLEKMVVSIIDGTTPDRKERLANFNKTLLTISRASSNIAILFVALFPATGQDHSLNARQCGKQAWPELLGARASVAVATIQRENRNVRPVVIQEGSFTTPDIRCDRVRVWGCKWGGESPSPAEPRTGEARISHIFSSVGAGHRRKFASHSGTGRGQRLSLPREFFSYHAPQRIPVARPRSPPHGKSPSPASYPAP
ncbi:hypothetical protein Sjap_003587 [Stephania japonica]|uniref:FBD domain-containing protein n=1 Tax=Stephania japonica TaxID=461633 RepID=A0AAP0KR45_9MAGN